MASSNTSIGRTEPLSMPREAEHQLTGPTFSVSDLATQLERLTTTVGKLAARMNANEQRTRNIQIPARPPPAPPFSTPYTTPVVCSIPLPSTTSVSGFLQNLYPLSAAPFQPGQSLLPALGAPSFNQPVATYHSAQSSMGPDNISGFQASPQPWLQERSGFVAPDHMTLSRPQMINPQSCWGPPGQLQQITYPHQDQSYPKVRMEPPKFDGTNANNWIRSVQYYFDHMGTPDTHRLYYVVMLFEPTMADWIWNYCSSHDNVTWYEFLDDVRRRFDPHCY